MKSRSSQRRIVSSNSARSRRLQYETLESRYVLVGDFQSAAQLISAQSLLGNIDTAYDSTGNLYVGGTYVNNANFDPTHSPGAPFNELSSAGFVAKYDSTGTLLWVHSFDACPASAVTGLAVDTSNNVIILGRYRGTQDFDPSTGTTSLTTNNVNVNNVFVAKYASSGAFVWALQGNTTSSADGADVAVDSSGNIYVCGEANGSFNGVTNSVQSAMVWKISSAGSTQWTNLTSSTSNSRTHALDVNAGRVAVAGQFFGTTTFDPGFSTTSQGMTDAFVWVLDTSGATQWAVSAGSSNFIGVEYALSVALDNTGRVYAFGYLDDTADMDPGSGTASLAAGNFVWQLNSDGTYAGAANVAWNGRSDSMTHGPLGEIYIAAYFFGTADVDWGTGVRNLTDSTGSGDFALLRYDAQGQLSGVAQVTKTGSSDVSAVAVNPAGQVAYLTTLYNGSIDLDPGPGSYTASAATTTSVYLTVLQEAFANLSVSGSTMSENSGTSTVRVTLDRTRSEDVTINLSLGGAATSGVDYTASSNALVILAGQTSGSITLMSLNDSTYELDESITVSVDGTFGARENGTQQVTASITDDDRYVVSGNTLTLLGTTGDDTFMIIRHATNAFYTYIGGEIRVYDSSVVQNVTTNLGAGTDRIEVYGYSGLTETVTTGDQTLNYVGGGLTINATNAEYIFGFGQSSDTAVHKHSIRTPQK
jgi:hypothetical protein